MNLTSQVPLSEERALQIRRCVGLARTAEINHLRRKRVLAFLTLESLLQGRANVGEAVELAAPIAEIGGRVRGKDAGQEAEVVRVYG